MSTEDAHKKMIQSIQKMIDDYEWELNEYDSKFFANVSKLVASGATLSKNQSDYLYTLFHNC